MKFVRSYLKSELNTFRGCDQTRQPKDNDKVYYCRETGEVIHAVVNKPVEIYHIGSLPGSFHLEMWRDLHDEIEFEDLVGMSKIESKSTSVQQAPKTITRARKK